MAAQSNEAPILDLLAKITQDSIEATGLDARTLMLVRIAALVSVDAPPASYLLNLRVAGESRVDAKQVQDVLAAVASIVGTARVASAAGRWSEPSTSSLNSEISRSRISGRPVLGLRQALPAHPHLPAAPPGRRQRGGVRSPQLR